MKTNGCRVSMLKARSCTLLAMLIGSLGPGASAKQVEQLSPVTINNAAIAAIPEWHGKKAYVLSHLDLTLPFKTKSQWTLVIVQDPHQPNDEIGMMQDHGPIAVCFVKGLSPQCQERYGPESGFPEFSTTYYLIIDSVVYADKNDSRPLLWLQTCSARSADGNCDVRTILFDYDRSADRFHPIFIHETGNNNNQETRFFRQGPLEGDVVVAYPTEDAPYTYWIEVYSYGQDERYDRILLYRGHTGYGDGNPLPVIDSEMPEILRRLGYWKPGDALPLPPGRECPHPVLRDKEEWCE